MVHATKLPPHAAHRHRHSKRQARRETQEADRWVRDVSGNQPSGGRYWRIKFRVAGKEKRLSLGVYPTVGLKAARSRRDDIRLLLANGEDPSDTRKADKVARTRPEASTFEAVAREWWAKTRRSGVGGTRAAFMDRA